MNEQPDKYRAVLLGGRLEGAGDVADRGCSGCGDYESRVARKRKSG